MGVVTIQRKVHGVTENAPSHKGMREVTVRKKKTSFFRPAPLPAVNKTRLNRAVIFFKRRQCFIYDCIVTGTLTDEEHVDNTYWNCLNLQSPRSLIR